MKPFCHGVAPGALVIEKVGPRVISVLAVAIKEVQRFVFSCLVSTTWKFGVCHGPSTFNWHLIYYIYIVRRAVSHFQLLFCEFLHHSLFQKLARRHKPSMATARTETTRGPTYSMARAIGATAWQKGFICWCHYLCCHSQWKSLVTWTNLSNGHIDEGYRMS